MGPTYFDVRFFVEQSVVALLLQLLFLRISAVPQRIRDPSLNGFLVRKGLRSRQGGIDVLRVL